MDPAADRPAPRHGPKIVLGLVAVMALPLVLIFAVFPLVRTQSFAHVEDLDPANVASLRVHLLNRQGIDGGPDIGPFYAAAADTATLLDALRAVPEVPEFEGADGPWLGEFRVLTKDGRHGTVRFYWQPPYRRDGEPVLRYKIGERQFEGGDLKGLIALIEAAAGRAE